MNKPAKLLALGAGTFLALAVWLAYLRGPEGVGEKEDVGSAGSPSSAAALAESVGTPATIPARRPGVTPAQIGEEAFRSALDLRSESLQERRSIDADSGGGKLLRLVQAPGFAYPIRIEYELDGAGRARRGRVLEMAADRLVVRLREEIDLALFRAELRGLGFTQARRLAAEPIYELVYERSDLDALPAAIGALRGAALANSLAYLEPNYIVHAQIAPDDARFADGTLWGLSNLGQDGGLSDADIDAPEGWDQRSDASSVVVAVIDTGIKYDHEDIVSNIWINPDEIPGNGLDDDGNGFVDDVHGINAIELDGDPMDDNGHGTHCAGTIGAEGNNGVGVVGVAWGVQLMGAKFLNASGSGSIADAVTCIDYATGMGANVLSNSWGGGAYSQALEDAIKAAETAGAVFVAAAGNSALDNDVHAFYPAGYNLPNVVAVASMDRAGALSPFSNYGKESVHVAAPGSDILSCSIDGESPYGLKSGTSMAAPHVSGLLALLMAEYPDDTLFHQINRVKQGTRSFEGLAGKTERGGVINVASALAMVEVPFPPLVTGRLPSEIVAKQGERIELAVVVASDSEVAYQWFLDGELMEGEEANSLIVESAVSPDAGLYELVASNEDGDARSSARVTVLVAKPDLSEALDTDLGEFFTYGDSVFTTYPFDSTVGENSIRSGEIEDGQESTLFVDLRGPAEVKFRWRLSAEEYYDSGVFKVDGTVEKALLTAGEWSEVVYSLSEERDYRLAWTYRKDRTMSDGQDALFLDAFEYRVAGDGPPIVVEQPKGAALALSSRYDLTVRALGNALQYQWFFEDAAVLGANQATLALTDVSQENAGSYRVAVSNGNGTVETMPARIVISENPVTIIEQPVAVVTQTGRDARFSVAASGALPISYQWFKDGSVLANETRPELLLKSVSGGDVGAYHVEALNVFNLEPQVSEAAMLKLQDVAAGPRFVKEPVAVLAKEGERHGLYGVAEGSLPILYQWFKDGKALAEATDRSLVFEAIGADDSGEYALRATNSEGSAASSSATVFVVAGLEEALDLEGVVWDVSRDDYFYAQNEVAFDGEDAVVVSDLGYGEFGYATLETVAQGGGNLSWQWKQESYIDYQAATLRVNGAQVESLVGQKDWTRSFARLTDGANEIQFRYSYSVGLKLWIDQVIIDHAPHIYQHPRSQVVRAGENLALSVDAWGAGELTYQWLKDGQALAGKTGATLEIDTSQIGTEGAYAVEVTNGHGSVGSLAAVVEVLDTPESEVANGNVTFNFDSPLPWKFYRDPELGIVLRSPSPAGTETTWFETTVEGPASLVFDWRLFGEECCPWIVITIDGNYFWSGSQSYDDPESEGMRRAALSVPAGSRTLRWTFEPGYNAVAGAQFAIVDEIVVTSDPVVSLQPKDLIAIEGSTATLNVEVIGTGPFSYEWRRVGEIAVLSTQARLAFSELDASAEGEYHCTVFDAEGRSAVSESATVTVLTGFHEAAGVDFGSFSQNGMGIWYPKSGVGQDGGAALLLSDPARKSTSNLRLRLEDQGQARMALRFKMKVENLPRDGFLSIWEGKGSQSKRTRIDESTDWQEFVLPLSNVSGNAVWWQVYRGVGETGGTLNVYLDAIELAPEPVFYESPKSVAAYWGEDVVLDAEVIGLEPMSFTWKRSGEVVTEVLTQPQSTLARIDARTAGLYQLAAVNQAGELLSEPVEARILDRAFGAAVGLPGAQLRTEGVALWKRSLSGGYKGVEALSVEGLEPGESSELRWRVNGPGTLSFRWKLESPTDGDRLFVSFGPFLAGGLYGDTDWQAYAVDVDAASYEVSVKMLSHELSKAAAGKGWIDAIRFEPDSSLGYEQWSLEAFGESGTPLEQRQWDADADGDRVLNFAEYALALDPLAADELPQPQYLRNGDAGAILVDFAMPPEAGDVAYGLQASWDLVNWHPLAAQQVAAVDESGQRGTLFYALKEADLDRAIHVRMCVYYLKGHE